VTLPPPAAMAAGRIAAVTTPLARLAALAIAGGAALARLAALAIAGGAALARLAALAIAGGAALALVLALAPIARAQGPAYGAQPPTPRALYSDGQTGRYLLGGTWLYRADPSDAGLSQGWFGNVAATDGWSPVTVPNAYNAGNFSSASMTGSVGWYRKDFTLPGSAFARYIRAADRRWIVRFESVNYRATVWLNGRRIGSHIGAYLPFELDLNGLRRGVNRLIVRVDDRRFKSDLPPGPGGGWWNYGGIVREVYVRAVRRVDISQVQVRPILPCPTCAALIEDQAVIRNLTRRRQRVQLHGSYGGAKLNFGTATIGPNKTWTAKAVATILHPRLWSIDRPSLYRATLTLADSQGRRLGGYVTQSGIRSITVVAGHLELNGRPLNLRGVNIHEQDLVEGSALDSAHLRRLVGWVRELGGTVIRAHYPLDPEIEEMADRDGILIWSEIPVYQVSAAYLGDPAWLASAHVFLKANIIANQNHPSVMLWSIGNELPTPATAAEARYIAGAAALSRKLDPTRPVAMAISNWPGVPCQQAYAPLDVIGDNEYFGWFDAGGGGSDDRDALGPFLDTVHACYPTKALMVTEFGFDANRNGPVEERGTYQFQADAVAYHLTVFATKPYLSAAMYFALQDYVAFPGYNGGDPRPDPPFNQKGLVDFQGNAKPGFATVSQLFHATVQIAPVARRRRPAAQRGL
jgi:beta-glucuronidase